MTRLRPLRWALRWPGRDRGSMAVEFVIAAPLLVLMLLLVSAGGEWLNLAGNVTAAARDAARAASLARTMDDAQAAATSAATVDLGSNCAAGPTQARALGVRPGHTRSPAGLGGGGGRPPSVRARRTERRQGVPGQAAGRPVP
jgi:Flp pilus assembly protein TadG